MTVYVPQPPAEGRVTFTRTHKMSPLSSAVLQFTRTLKSLEAQPRKAGQLWPRLTAKDQR